jgi:hypothetical protein
MIFREIHFPKYRDAMIRLKPAFSSKEAKFSLEWVNDDVSTGGNSKGKAKATVPSLIEDAEISQTPEPMQSTSSKKKQDGEEIAGHIVPFP